MNQGGNVMPSCRQSDQALVPSYRHQSSVAAAMRIWSRRAVAIMLAAFFVYQVWMAMEQYQAGQVVTIPSRLSLSGNMDFPDLTVCPVFAAGVNQRTISRNISRIYQEVSKKTEGLIMLVGMKLLQLVNKTESSESLSLGLNPVMTIQQAINVMKGSTISFRRRDKVLIPMWNGDMIICQTYRAPRKLPPGFQNQVSITVNATGLAYISLYIHNKGMMIPGYVDFFGSTFIVQSGSLSSVFESPSLIKALSPAFRVRREARKRLAKKTQRIGEKDCLEKQDWNLGQCMYTHMSKILGCRLPWLAKEECSNGGKSEQLPCQTAEEFAQFMTISEQLISMDEAQFQEKTGCDVPCSFFHYETKKIYTDGKIAFRVDNHTTNLAYVRIYFSEAGYTVQEEVLLFTFGDLVASVGGNLGLLLGMSVLNFYDITAGYIERAFRTHP